MVIIGEFTLVGDNLTQQNGCTVWLLARSFNIRSKLVNYSLTRIDLELSDVGAGKSLQNLNTYRTGNI